MYAFFWLVFERCLLSDLDYEQQRKDHFRKHRIDLEDGNGLSEDDNRRQMERKEVDQLTGAEDGQGVFTWREKNRKKVSPVMRVSIDPSNILSYQSSRIL